MNCQGAGIRMRNRSIQWVPCEAPAVMCGLCNLHLMIAAENAIVHDRHQMGNHITCNPLVDECCAGENPNSASRIEASRDLALITRMPIPIP